MKRIILIISAFVFAITLSACGESTPTLRVLNWGEYMDEDLVTQFEEEYGVKVVYDTVDSNEAMELRIKSGTTKYDIAFPSDYMIDKLRQQDLLHEIDTTKLTGFENVSIIDEVASLTADEDYNSYFVPYFWGTLGIMYNTNTVSEEDLTDGFRVLFEQKDATEEDKLTVGLYDSSRDSVAAALLALGYSVNSDNASELNEAETYMKNGEYLYIGTDNLKTLVQSENLDLALVYSGDYFDTLYSAESDELDINFAYYVPETTNIWVDGFVIPTTSENVDLAHDFINFFLNKDVTVQNADWVGYAPVLQEAYDYMVSQEFYDENEYNYAEYDNYNPFPEGTYRQVYQYVSLDRFNRLNEILDATKASQND